MWSTDVWVVMGLASRLPVATFTDPLELARWLRTRRGTSMLRVFLVRNNTWVTEITTREE